ncbi:MAG: extracellular solute-binding protein [Pseudomonadota bacterium]
MAGKMAGKPRWRLSQVLQHVASLERAVGLPIAAIAVLAALIWIPLAGTAGAVPPHAKSAPRLGQPPISQLTGVTSLDARAHGIAMHGAPALPETFAHLPYVNPDAPKGGRLAIGIQGTFDSLNPFIVRGVAVNNIRSYVFESLMARSADEPFSLYGLIAEHVAVSDDRREIVFYLNRAARFADGHPITAEDVLFSREILAKAGRPYMRSHYAKVEQAVAIDPHTVRFVFSEKSDREIPLILALMPILPKHAVDVDTFDQTTLEPMLGSGPYRIGRVEPGRSVVFERDPNYWAKDLPIRRGLYNFDEVKLEFFRDATALFEAFKSGAVNFRYENAAVRWAEGYAFPAAKSGQVVKRALDIGVPDGMRALVFNTRRAVFSDKRVRQALTELFDFEWINQTLFNGLFARSNSFFARSDLSSAGRPMSAQERGLLDGNLAEIDPAIADGSWQLPKTDGSGRNRNALKRAVGLLHEAGFEIRNRQMVNKQTGAPLTFEFLARRKSEERMMLAFASTLKRIGIGVTIRVVDGQQYWARLRTFDFDMIQWRWPASLSPGNEQINRWSTAFADVEGSLNYAGVKNATADRLIDALLAARERDDFEAAVRAFDRVLLSGAYVIPLYHAPTRWVAHWSYLKKPEASVLFGLELNAWWSEREE